MILTITSHPGIFPAKFRAIKNGVHNSQAVVFNPMSGLSLGIVLIAALLHAFWNTLTKKSRNKIVFIWWFILIALHKH